MKTRNAALASAAAALFVAGIGNPAIAAHHEEGEKIKCEGVNSCKGESSCKTLFSDCAGHNDCKGKGFVMLSAEECEQTKAAMDAESE
jgi:uncharacterized membrane protein